MGRSVPGEGREILTRIGINYEFAKSTDILRSPNPIRAAREMYVLGSVLLHPDKQLLTVGDHAVSLQRKPFQVLVFLVENRHRMVTRKELLDQFWDGKEVYDQSLSKAVGTIRKALGEPAASDYIETRWGLGYRYIGPFLEGPASPVPIETDVVADASSVVHAPVVVEERAGGWKHWRMATVAAALLIVVLGGLRLMKPRHQVAAQSPRVQAQETPDTQHPDAYAKYKKAEFFARMRTPASVSKAIDLLNEVILIDPKYARAYAALAECYGLEGFYHFAPPTEVYPKAKDAAYKALALDNSLAQAHVALLGALTDYDWDWEGAEREYKAAIALDPNYAVAYQYFGYALIGAGRAGEALAVMKHAADLDPVSPSVLTSLAWEHYLLRQDKQAVEQCQRVLELYPNFVVAHQVLGVVYGQMGQRDQALAELNQATKLEKDSGITTLLIDYELAKGGKRERATRDLESFESRKNVVPDYYVALAWNAAGNREKAQAALERAYSARSNWLIYLQYDPRFEGLRRSGTVQSLIQRVKSGRKRNRITPADENLAELRPQAG
jgi:DNA-binding winged helix-turn-helix (wHTH) protein/tetratricopeptide (TPR) repeat protein